MVEYPDVYLPRMKELNFLDRHYDEGLHSVSGMLEKANRTNIRPTIAEMRKTLIDNYADSQ